MKSAKLIDGATKRDAPMKAAYSQLAVLMAPSTTGTISPKRWLGGDRRSIGKARWCNASPLAVSADTTHSLAASFGLAANARASSPMSSATNASPVAQSAASAVVNVRAVAASRGRSMRRARRSAASSRSTADSAIAKATRCANSRPWRSSVKVSIGSSRKAAAPSPQPSPP